MTLDPALREMLRASLALLLLAAAWHKLRDPARFRAALAGYALLPARALAAFAALAAGLELVLAAALLVPGAGAAPALATAALLALYAAAIGVNLARGNRAIDCGCGARPRPLAASLVWRNAALVAIALAAALPPNGRALAAFDALAIAGGAVALAALHAAADSLLASHARLRALPVRP